MKSGKYFWFLSDNFECNACGKQKIKNKVKNDRKKKKGIETKFQQQINRKIQ